MDVKKLYKDFIQKSFQLIDKINKCNQKECKELHDVYKKEHTKVIKDINNSLHDMKKLKEIKNKFDKSKISIELKKCSVEKCNKLHKESIDLTKNFFQNVCKIQKKKEACHAYKELSKIKEVNFTNYEEANRIGRKLVK